MQFLDLTTHRAFSNDKYSALQKTDTAAAVDGDDYEASLQEESGRFTCRSQLKIFGISPVDLDPDTRTKLRALIEKKRAILSHNCAGSEDTVEIMFAQVRMSFPPLLSLQIFFPL